MSNCDFKLSVTKSGDEIQITVKSEESSNSYENISITLVRKLVINDFSSTGGITLDIQIPAKTFEKLFVKSKNGNVDVIVGNTGFSTVPVDSKHGIAKNDPKLKGIYKASGEIITKNGNIRFY